ncbi:MAG: pyridoxal phosphate-dependent decarboxylase family protein [Candidatus Limnocylindrales bacterium]
MPNPPRYHSPTPNQASTVLLQASELALRFLDRLDARPVGATADAASLRSALGGGLPAAGEPSEVVITRLARDVDDGLIAMAGPRYFGFVIGGHHPAALAADWLTSTWDQNLGLYAGGPALSIVEEVAGGWMLDLLGLPSSASFGFTTGAMMAIFAGIAAGRHALLARSGWDVERQGLYGAPGIDVVVGAEAHATVQLALQYLGLGRERVNTVPTDGQGRLRADELAASLQELRGPVLVCAQAGNVNTGAFDPLSVIVQAVRSRDDAWLHIDGAFGLWAAASPRFAGLMAGAEQADSWATDAHKWLNVPYDCGFVACADRKSHQAAMSITAAYLVQDSGERDGVDWGPEFSRRARGVPVYAVLRALGRNGVRDLVERCCDLAARMARQLAAHPSVTILNDVVLDQVLVRFSPPGVDRDNATAADRFTREVIATVQRDGTCWLSGTTWHGQAAMRVSVVNWSTTDADADRSVEAILRCVERLAAGLPEG